MGQRPYILSRKNSSTVWLPSWHLPLSVARSVHFRFVVPSSTGLAMIRTMPRSTSIYTVIGTSTGYPWSSGAAKTLLIRTTGQRLRMSMSYSEICLLAAKVPQLMKQLFKLLKRAWRILLHHLPCGIVALGTRIIGNDGIILSYRGIVYWCPLTICALEHGCREYFLCFTTFLLFLSWGSFGLLPLPGF